MALSSPFFFFAFIFQSPPQELKAASKLGQASNAVKVYAIHFLAWLQIDLSTLRGRELGTE